MQAWESRKAITGSRPWKPRQSCKNEQDIQLEKPYDRSPRNDSFFIEPFCKANACNKKKRKNASELAPHGSLDDSVLVESLPKGKKDIKLEKAYDVQVQEKSSSSLSAKRTRAIRRKERTRRSWPPMEASTILSSSSLWQKGTQGIHKLCRLG